MNILKEIVKTKSWIIENIFILVGVLLVIGPANPLNMPVTFRDSGVFLYTGSRILQGDLPYVDVWDHKPPVIFYINALGLFLGGGSRWGVWFIELIALLFTTYIGFRLIKRIFGLFPSILAMYLWLLSLCFLIHGGNLTTEYTLLIQFACLWLVYLSEKDGFANWRGLLIGVLCSIAFLTKQNTIGIGVAIFLYLAVNRLAGRQFTKLLYELTIIASGGLLFLVPIMIYFGYQHMLSDFWNSAFTFNFFYSSSTPRESILAINSGIKILSNTYIAPLALIGYSGGMALMIFSKKANPKLRILTMIGLINLPIELFLVSISGRNYQHYYMALLPILVFFSGLSFWLLYEGISIKFDSKLAKLVITLCTLFLFTLFNMNDYLNLVREYRGHRDSNIISYIEKSTTDDDTVLLWGAEAAINFLSNRQSPSRFVYQAPLYQDVYANEKIITEFLYDVVQMKPALIIDTKNPGTPFMEFKYSSSKIDEYEQYIRSHYVKKEKIGSWVVYEYVGGP